MPNPRVQERDIDDLSETYTDESSALPVAAKVASVAPAMYVEDAEAQVVSNIDYKDLARHYSEVVTGPPSSSMGVVGNGSAESHRGQQPFSAASKPSVQLVRAGGEDQSIHTAGHRTVGGRTTEPTYNSTNSPTTNAVEDTRGYMEDTNGYIESETGFEDTHGKCRARRRLWIMLFIVTFAIGAAVGITMGVIVGNEESEDPISLSHVPDDMFGEEDSGFGFSIATNANGDCVAVADESSVYVYEHDGRDKWNEVGSKIQAPENTTTTTGLLENGTVLIRAPVVVEMSHDGQSVAVGWSSYQDNRGLVQVYRYSKDSKLWETHGHSIVGQAAGYFFGASLDLSDDGSTLAVGAPGNGGLVSVYTFDRGVWQTRGTQISKDDIRGLSITSVSLARDGKTLAFGGVAGTADQVARMFKFDISTGDWEEMGNGITSMQGGTAYIVDLSGDGTTVGVSNYYYLETNPGNLNDAIDVRAYKWSETFSVWRQKGQSLHTFSEGDKEGYFISMSDDGRTMVMGDPGRRGEASRGGNTGHAHVYIYNGETWFQLGPNILGEAAGDHFGYDVVVSGDGKRLVASAPYSRHLGTQSPHGRVRVFDIPSV